MTYLSTQRAASITNGLDNDMISLDTLQPGERAIIRSIQGDTAEEVALMEMGLLVGTSIDFIKSAPLGDPIELRIRGYHLSIRRSEARAILVEKV